MVMMVKWIASTDSFDLEISEEIKLMINKLQETIPTEEAYLHIFIMLYTCDKFISKIAEEDPDLFNTIIKEDSDIEQLVHLVFNKLDYIYGEEEEK